MAGDNDLPSKGQQDWVYHVAEQLAAAEIPTRGDGQGGGSSRRRWLIPILAVVAVAAIVIAIVVMSGGDDDAVETATPTSDAAVVSTLAQADTSTSVVEAAAVATTVSTVGPTTEAASPSTTAATTTSSAATSTSAETSTTSAGTSGTSPTAAEVTTTVPADLTGPPVRWAEYGDGKVTLKGRVPDQATADEVAGRAAQVLGLENVIVEYVIDPSAPRPDSAPLYVNNSILFGPGLALLNAEARATLDLGATLLTLFPQVTFDIEGHTDSVGTDEENLALSQRRVDAIVAYLVETGVDPTRLTATAKGESEPIADNATPGGQALNRRIEIQVNGFLA